MIDDNEHYKVVKHEKSFIRDSDIRYFVNIDSLLRFLIGLQYFGNRSRKSYSILAHVFVFTIETFTIRFGIKTQNL